jgi:hypothetical protein
MIYTKYFYYFTCYHVAKSQSFILVTFIKLNNIINSTLEYRPHSCVDNMNYIQTNFLSLQHNFFGQKLQFEIIFFLKFWRP